jgi:cyclopentanol dehydrogenase
MNRVNGKVVLITGAASGMGRTHAELLASEGATVALADTNVDATKAVAEEITQRGGKAIAAKIDVTNAADWQETVFTIQRTFGRLDGLVNNAGIIIYKALVDTSLEEWNRVFTVNVTGAFLGCRAVAETMKGSGGGSIVNMSSALGMVAAAGAASYVASKGAVTMLTKAAAAEFAAYGIRVNSVHPGLVDTPMIAQFRSDPAAMTALLGPTLIRRVAEPIEISRAVLFLLSDEASYMTGTGVPVDGGYTAV